MPRATRRECISQGSAAQAAQASGTGEEPAVTEKQWPMSNNYLTHFNKAEDSGAAGYSNAKNNVYQIHYSRGVQHEFRIRAAAEYDYQPCYPSLRVLDPARDRATVAWPATFSATPRQADHEVLIHWRMKVECRGLLIRTRATRFLPSPSWARASACSAQPRDAARRTATPQPAMKFGRAGRIEMSRCGPLAHLA